MTIFKSKGKLAAWLLLALLAPVSCGYPTRGSHMGYGGPMGGYAGYGGIVMWVLLILVAGAVVYFAVVQNRKAGHTQNQSEEKPLEILKKRYARGEIDHETFVRLKKEIDG